MSQTRTARVRRVHAVNPAANPMFVDAASLLTRVLDSLLPQSSAPSKPRLTTRPHESIPRPAAHGPEWSHVPDSLAATGATTTFQGSEKEIAAQSLREIGEEFKEMMATAPVVSTASQQTVISLAQAAVRAPHGTTERKQAMHALRSFVATDHQDIITQFTYGAVKEALTEISFAELVLKPEDGYILARQANDGPQVRVDVINGIEGTLLALDADCFDGSSCEDALGRLEGRLRAKGLDLEVAWVRRKPRPHAVPTHVGIRRDS